MKQGKVGDEVDKELMPVVVVEHVTKGATGHVKRGASCCEPVFPGNLESRNNAMMLVEAEMEMLIDEHPDTMILITIELMTMEKVEKMGEFMGW